MTEMTHPLATAEAVGEPEVAITVENVSKLYKVYSNPKDLAIELLMGKPRHHEHWALRERFLHGWTRAGRGNSRTERRRQEHVIENHRRNARSYQRQGRRQRAGFGHFGARHWIPSRIYRA